MGQLKLYVSRQADSIGRYVLEQVVQMLFGGIPTVIGVGLRGVFYRLILRMDGIAAIENGVRLRFAGHIHLGRNVYLDQGVYLHACPQGITIGDKAYWGRGYGREAVWLLVEYGFTKLNLRRIYLRVHGRNERAIRAYRACGFIEEGRLRQHVWNDGAYDDLLYMAVLHADV